MSQKKYTVRAWRLQGSSRCAYNRWRSSQTTTAVRSWSWDSTKFSFFSIHSRNKKGVVYYR